MLIAETPVVSIPNVVPQGQAELNGRFYLWNGSDPPCDPAEPTCDFSSLPPESLSRIYVQKDAENNWQAYSASDLVSLTASHVDVSDNIESVPWRATSFVRVEFVPFAPTDLTGFEMVHISGLGVDEVWGVRASNAQQAVAAAQAPGYATLFSNTMMISLTKLEPEAGTIDVLPDPAGTAYIWNPTTKLWEKAGGGAVAQTAQENFTAEINVTGRMIYGYNWKLRNMVMNPGVEKAGWWRLTYFSGSATSPLDFTASTALFDPIAGPVSELSVEPVAEDDSGSNPNYPRTPVVDPLNDIVYIDIYITGTAGGGGGGGGGGEGEKPDHVGIYSGGLWQLDVNGNGVSEAGADSLFSLGFPGAQKVVGDWNGDGTTKVGVYNQGYWFLDYDGNGVWDGGTADRMFPMGFAGATPFVGDWNGDGTTKVGVYNQGYWFLDYNGNGVWDGPPNDKLFPMGFAGATPVVGDWNGDGKTKVGVYNQGYWFLDYDGDLQWDGGTVDRAYAFGFLGAKPLVGDWNGDGRTKVGIYNQGIWFLDYDGNAAWDGGVADRVFALGWTDTIPVLGDWNGDGRTKAGVFFEGVWLLDSTGDGVWDGGISDPLYFFGMPGDEPVVGKW
ncbi:MAG: hypothetical protein GC160_00490 [Acidobacteria bacterium]|nr:hypothetical protein [Acidobacteriota bacterium]